MRSILSALVIAAAGALTFGSAQAAGRGGSIAGEFEAHQAKFAEFLSQRLKLNEAKKASFKDFQDARTKAVETATTRLCATKPNLSSFEGRLGFHQIFLEDRLEAVRTTAATSMIAATVMVTTAIMVAATAAAARTVTGRRLQGRRPHGWRRLQRWRIPWRRRPQWRRRRSLGRRPSLNRWPIAVLR
jgi:hypothetical protein